MKKIMTALLGLMISSLVYATTSYSTPNYSTSSYSTPSYAALSYSTPSYSVPVYSNRIPNRNLGVIINTTAHPILVHYSLCGTATKINKGGNTCVGYLATTINSQKDIVNYTAILLPITQLEADINDLRFTLNHPTIKILDANLNVQNTAQGNFTKDYCSTNHAKGINAIFLSEQTDKTGKHIIICKTGVGKNTDLNPH